MTPYNFLRHFWEIPLVNTYSSNLKGEVSLRPFQADRPQQDPVGRNCSISNQKNIVVSRFNHKKEGRGNPTFPLKHHRFKVNMPPSQGNPPQHSNSIKKKAATSSLKHKKEGRGDPAFPLKQNRFKQAAAILYLMALTLHWLIIPQNSKCQSTLHYQKSAPKQLKSPSYHCQSSAFLELIRREKPPPLKHPP